MVDGVHAGDDREQHLRRADVARRLLAADVLLARLQREAIRGVAVAVDGRADQAARHAALQGVGARHVRRVRPAVAHRHAEALGRSDGDVGAELARRREQGEREEIGRHGDADLLRAERRDQRAVIDDLAGRAGILQEHAEAVRRERLPGTSHDDRDARGLCPRAHHGDRLRMAVVRHEERPALARRAPRGERHRFRRRRPLVEQRRVGHVEAGKVGDHGLEVEQRFQAALRDLRLVRRVRRVPRRVLEDVAQDHRRRVGAVITHADERPQHLVLRRQPPERGEDLGLVAHVRKVERPGVADRRRDQALHHLVERGEPELGEHRLLLRRARPDVPGRERGQRARREPRSHGHFDSPALAA